MQRPKRLVKGSPETKMYMTYLRSLRKRKSSKTPKRSSPKKDTKDTKDTKKQSKRLDKKSTLTKTPKRMPRIRSSLKKERQVTSPARKHKSPMLKSDRYKRETTSSRTPKRQPVKSCVEITVKNSTPSVFKRYSSRMSPSYLASECREGMTKVGKDGHKYRVSKPDTLGRKRWTRLSHKK